MTVYHALENKKDLIRNLNYSKHDLKQVLSFFHCHFTVNRSISALMQNTVFFLPISPI